MGTMRTPENRGRRTITLLNKSSQQPHTSSKLTYAISLRMFKVLGLWVGCSAASFSWACSLFSVSAPHPCGTSEAQRLDRRHARPVAWAGSQSAQALHYQSKEGMEQNSMCGTLHKNQQAWVVQTTGGNVAGEKP